MAVLNSIMFNGANKQIGGVVLYSRKGQTIARTRASQVSNPRTPIQMMQRVKLANLVMFYRANAAWMRDAFETKRKKESDYNAFVSNNLANSLVALAKSDVDAGAAVVAPYKVTSGSLGVIEMQLNGTDLVSNLLVGNLAITENTTIGELSQALISNNEGVREGMQLSLIINLQLASAGAGVPYINVRAHEIILATDSTALVSDFIPDGILEVVGSTTKSLGISVASLGDGAATFILSETTGGKTAVSTQSLVFFGSNAVYRSYTSQAQMNAAIASYGENVENFLSSNSANGSSAVATTLALMGIDVAGREYVANGRLTESLAASDAVQFNFNRQIPEGATVSAYYVIGTQATHYNLTTAEVSQNRRAITAVVGSTSLPGSEGSFTMVAVIDGDEFPIKLVNAREADGDE